jgi:hypothetical protein
VRGKSNQLKIEPVEIGLRTHEGVSRRIARVCARECGNNRRHRLRVCMRVRGQYPHQYAGGHARECAPKATGIAAAREGEYSESKKGDAPRGGQVGYQGEGPVC